MAGDAAARAWFELYCESELVFHVAHVASAFVRLIRHGRLSPLIAFQHHDLLAEVGPDKFWSSDKHILKHKDAALNILQQQVKHIAKLSRYEVDHLIFASITLARHEISLNQPDLEMMPLFLPHFPEANWAKLYGRITSVEAHLNAVAALIDYQGGLSRIQVPALAATVAR